MHVALLSLSLLAPPTAAAPLAPRAVAEVSADGAATRCLTYHRQATKHLAELARRLKRLQRGGRKQATEARKLVAAWGRLQVWNRKLGSCIDRRFGDRRGEYNSEKE
jgi:hypothetical protein